MVREYFLVYLIYGFAMINMGIFCLAQNGFDESDPPLLRSMKYLGWFGIIHGISEWTTLLTIADIYPDYTLYLYNFLQILKALSFALLFYFGLNLMPAKKPHKKAGKTVLIVWSICIVAGYASLAADNGLDYHRLNQGYGIIAIRYGLALTGGTVSAAALFMNASLIERRNSGRIARRYRQLAWIIFAYTLLEGLLVQKASFYPANIINRELFYSVFRFQILFLKAVVGVVINYLLVKVVDTFRWQQEERIRKLEQDKAASSERSRLSLEIHDSIIQMMYAAGLKLEYLLINKDETGLKDKLGEIRDNLNLTIEKTRELMTSSSLDIVTPGEMKEKIRQIIQNYDYKKDLSISFRHEISHYQGRDISPEKSTQIYYIVQEAVSNVVKHSKATRADVIWEDKHDTISISVIDNGIGLSEADLLKEKHFGIRSMRERAERIGGEFNIIGLKKGLKVSIEIPWEDENGR